MTVLLDANACRFFSPKEMHPLLTRFDQLLAAVNRPRFRGGQLL